MGMGPTVRTSVDLLESWRVLREEKGYSYRAIAEKVSGELGRPVSPGVIWSAFVGKLFPVIREGYGLVETSDREFLRFIRERVVPFLAERDGGGVYGAVSEDRREDLE